MILVKTKSAASKVLANKCRSLPGRVLTNMRLGWKVFPWTNTRLSVRSVSDESKYLLTLTPAEPLLASGQESVGDSGRVSAEHARKNRRAAVVGGKRGKR
jgi:hypothetical protein